MSLLSDAGLMAGGLLAALAANLLVFRRGYGVVNPVSIATIAFIAPMLLATLRLSGLQDDAWTRETYLMLHLSLAAWTVVPALVLLTARRDPSRFEERTHALARLEGRFGAAVVWVARPFALAVAAAFFGANVVQSGSLLPLTDPELIQTLHTRFPPILRIVATQIPAAVALTYLALCRTRSLLDVALLATLLIAPLTRGGRIDSFEALVILAVLYVFFPVVRPKRPVRLVLVLIAAGALAAFTLFGTQRLNRFGQYDFTFNDIIEWNGVPDPTGTVPTLYAYFPLSFENLDRFVRQNPDVDIRGVASLNWLFVGLLKLNLVFDELGDIDYVSLYSPVSRGATVPTMLAAFYLDFGPRFAFLPLVAIGLAWSWLFLAARRRVLYAVLFAVMTSGVALSAFQPIVVSAGFGQSMLLVFVLLGVAQDVARTPLRQALR